MRASSAGVSKLSKADSGPACRPILVDVTTSYSQDIPVRADPNASPQDSACPPPSRVSVLQGQLEVQDHCPLSSLTHECPVDSITAPTRQGIDDRPAETDRIRAETQRFQDVGTVPYTAVNEDLEVVPVQHMRCVLM